MRTSAVVLIFVTVGNGYYFKFMRLRRKPKVRVFFFGLPALALARAVDPWRWSGEENALGVK